TAPVTFSSVRPTASGSSIRCRPNSFSLRVNGERTYHRSMPISLPGVLLHIGRELMSKIVGIDLGTTNSLVATVDSGIPFVIADAEGRRLTPSVVHIPGAEAAPVIGHKANRVRVLKPSETVYSVKRFMGRRGADIPREEMLVTYPVQGEGAGPVTIDLHGRSWTPEEISAEVLKKLKRDAESYFGEA